MIYVKAGCITCHMQNVLMKVRLKPGKLPKFREYMAEFERRRPECEASLAEEGTAHELFFIEGETVYVYKRIFDLKDTRAKQKASSLPIYDVMRRMMAETFDGVEELFSELEFGKG